MNKKIEEAIKKWKPKIGNLNHIRALEILGKIQKREALRKNKKDMNDKINREIKELNKELTLEERNLLFLLK